MDNEDEKIQFELTLFDNLIQMDIYSLIFDITKGWG